MGETKIEWADRVWNPVTGCTKVSEGCRHCYAERIAGRFWKDRKFTEVQCHEDKLKNPLRWKKPSRVFVNSMSDLFHPDVPDDFIDEIFAVMGLCQDHKFIVLTKRPERMVIWFSDIGGTTRRDWILSAAGRLLNINRIKFCEWPIPNIWLGVTAENQKAADERIPLLMQTPAAVRFVSVEPMLGPVDLTRYLLGDCFAENARNDKMGVRPHAPTKKGLDWVICGGESGTNARPMHPDWARSLRDQCVEANVPFFFKQWGEWELTDEGLEIQRLANGEKERKLTSINIPGAIQYQEAWFRWIGKKAAGRRLDGREWNEFPEVKK